MFLDRFESLPHGVVSLIFDLVNIKKGERYIDLGSGDGRLVSEAKKRGAFSKGYELNKTLVIESRKKELNVINKDCFDGYYKNFDVITCWFTKLPETKTLMNKLYKEMSPGSRLIKVGKIEHEWVPEKVFMVDRYWICLYKK